MRGSTASADTIVRGLGARWHSPNHAICRCPAHRDSTPSLSVGIGTGGKILLKCFAGCTFEEVRDALIALKLWPATDEEAAAIRERQSRLPPTRLGGVSVAETMLNRQRAQELWDKARDARGTLAEEYLRGRGIRLPLPDSVRFHPECWHRETQQAWPALIARLTDNKGFVCIQRVYLDGAKKADIKMPKKTLGRMFGAAVRLWAPIDDTLGLAEGIETAMSSRQLYSIPTWAVCAAERLALVDLPPEVRHVVIFGDDGDPGHRAADKAQRSIEERGIQCEVVFPQAHFAGDGARDDFNSVLQDGSREKPLRL